MSNHKIRKNFESNTIEKLGLKRLVRNIQQHVLYLWKMTLAIEESSMCFVPESKRVLCQTWTWKYDWHRHTKWPTKVSPPVATTSHYQHHRQQHSHPIGKAFGISAANSENKTNSCICEQITHQTNVYSLWFYFKLLTELNQQNCESILFEVWWMTFFFIDRYDRMGG